MVNLKGRSFLTLKDYSKEEISTSIKKSKKSRKNWENIRR